MTTILHIEVGPRGAQSWSRRFGLEALARLQRRYPDAQVIRRDLAATPPPLIDAVFANAILRPAEQWDAADRDALGYSEQAIGELEAADVVLIATPMNNYTVPATLKGWIDHIVRIRRTFVGSPQGKVGLLRDRPTYVVTAAGGYHSGEGAAVQPDFLTPYLRAILATIGIKDVRFLSLQGMTRGPEAVAQASEAARATLDEWFGTDGRHTEAAQGGGG